MGRKWAGGWVNNTESGCTSYLSDDPFPADSAVAGNRCILWTMCIDRGPLCTITGVNGLARSAWERSSL